MNRRFWIKRGESWVKLCLKPNKVIIHQSSWDNGEGHSYVEESWGFYYGNDQVVSNVITMSGNDCDGVHREKIVKICHVNQLQILRPERGRKERRPNWKKKP